MVIATVLFRKGKGFRLGVLKIQTTNIRPSPQFP